jgi:CheY-like chemotaxis protein
VDTVFIFMAFAALYRCTYSHSLSLLTFNAVCASFLQDNDDTYTHTELSVTEGTVGEGEGEGNPRSTCSPVAVRCSGLGVGVEGMVRGVLQWGAEAVKSRYRELLGACESLYRRHSSSTARSTDSSIVAERGRGTGGGRGSIELPDTADHADTDIDIEAADTDRGKWNGNGNVTRNRVCAGADGQSARDLGDGKGAYESFSQSEGFETDGETRNIKTFRPHKTGDEDRVHGILRIVVTDSGAGISEEDQLLLFKGIVQFHPELLQAGGGSGLGLWITSSIVQMHSGSIKVRSGGAGNGSTFTVEIGMQRSLSAQATYAAAVEAAEAEAEATAGIYGAMGRGSRDGVGDGDGDEDGPAFPFPYPLSQMGTVRIIHGRSSSSDTKNYTDCKGTVDIIKVEEDESCQASDKRLLINGKHFSTSMPPSPHCVMCVPLSPVVTGPIDSTWIERGSGDGITHGDGLGHVHVAADSVEFLNRSIPGYPTGTAAANPLHRTPLPPLSRSTGSRSRSAASSFSSSSSLPTHHPIKSALEVMRGTSSFNSSTNSNSIKSDGGGDCVYDVLVVDDSSLNRKVLLKLLRTAGCTCEEASDGQQAVDRVKERLSRTGTGTGEDKIEYDAILMDFVMPVMDGPTATQIIRGLGYTGPIFGVTGNTLESDVMHFMAHGVNAVLPKPFDFAEFKSLMADKDKAGGAGSGHLSSSSSPKCDTPTRPHLHPHSAPPRSRHRALTLTI